MVSVDVEHHAYWLNLQSPSSHGTKCNESICSEWESRRSRTQRKSSDLLQCCFRSTETIRLIMRSPGRPPRLSHSFWAWIEKRSLINQSINVSPCPRSHWGQFNRPMPLAPRKSKLLSQSRETTGKDYAILLNLSTLPESCVLCFDLIWGQGRVLPQILQVSTYKEPTKPTKGIQGSPLVQSFFQQYFFFLLLPLVVVPDQSVTQCL